MNLYRGTLLLAGTILALATSPLMARDHNAGPQASWWSSQQRYDVSTPGSAHAPSPAARLATGSAQQEELVQGDLEHLTVNMRYTSQITHIEIGPEGLPCNVVAQGQVFSARGKSQGTFTATFPSCPTFQPLPSALAGNMFGIPAGTVMPAWQGEVDYALSDGTIYTSEQAFIFPTDMSNPESPLGVLSTAVVTGGTRGYKGATGSINTPDGYDNSGSLLGDLYLPQE